MEEEVILEAAILVDHDQNGGGTFEYALDPETVGELGFDVGFKKRPGAGLSRCRDGTTREETASGAEEESVEEVMRSHGNLNLRELSWVSSNSLRRSADHYFKFFCEVYSASTE